MMWVCPSYFSKFVQFVLSTQVFSVEMLFMLKYGDTLRRATRAWGPVGDIRYVYLRFSDLNILIANF